MESRGWCVVGEDQMDGADGMFRSGCFAVILWLAPGSLAGGGERKGKGRCEMAVIGIVALGKGETEDESENLIGCPYR